MELRKDIYFMIDTYGSISWKWCFRRSMESKGYEGE